MMQYYSFDLYQLKAKKYAKYPKQLRINAYPVLGLCGEVGEVAEKFKKLERDHDGVVTPEFTREIVKELGDVLWYIAEIASTLNIAMGDIASQNIAKLEDRYQRNKIQGDGDNR